MKITKNTKIPFVHVLFRFNVYSLKYYHNLENEYSVLRIEITFSNELGVYFLAFSLSSRFLRASNFLNRTFVFERTSASLAFFPCSFGAAAAS